MEYRRFADKIIVRIDKDESILDCLKEVSENEGVRLAEVSAIGALSSFTVQLYNVAEQRFYSNSFSGSYEIVSLLGTVNTKDGEYYSHIHLSAADSSASMFGGHLKEAVVGATCEMIITVLDGTVDRCRDEATGLNVFKF